MRTGDWLPIMARNRFRVSPTLWGLAFTVTAASGFNSLMALLQRMVLGRKLDAVRIEQPPVFIVGHWRSGTTLLHELLVCDPQFAYPDTYECLAPNHFHVTRRIVVPWAKYLLPRQRPMDNMAVGWERPQEDEFALLNMGLPSPYEGLAFPNHPWPHLDFLDMERVGEDERRRWQQGLLEFLKSVSYRKPKALVLKSPAHLGRIEALVELFPEARFVHIVRDPYVVYASTVRLWKSLTAVQSLQRPKHIGLEEHVLECFERMYRAVEKQQSAVAPQRFHELRYEDLVADPLEQVEQIYQRLDLGDFAAMRPHLEDYLADVADYKTNRYRLPDEEHARVTERWGWIIEKYGYSTQREPAAAEG